MPTTTNTPALLAEKRLTDAAKWCIVSILVGAVVGASGLAMVGFTGWGHSLISPGGTLAAAGVAGLVATRSVVTWSQQRQRDSESAEYRHREEVYGEVIDQMTAVFLGGVDLVKDSKTRAKAGLWADPATIEALARWRETIHPIGQRGGEVGELKEPVMTAYYNVVLAMRRELSAGKGEIGQAMPGRDFLLRSIFDDRPPLPSAMHSSQNQSV